MNYKSVTRTNIPVSITKRMDKIYSYIKYCQRLEDAYRTKHEEVRVLNNYLKRIQRVLPENVSENCPEVDDIITYIEGLPNVPDTNDLNETLKRMIDQQKVWREESTRNYNLINRKIEKMSEARDVVSSNSENNTITNRRKTGKPKFNTTKTRIKSNKHRGNTNKTKVKSNKKRRMPNTGKTIKLVPVSTTKKQPQNKQMRINQIRKRKTQVLGKPK